MTQGEGFRDAAPMWSEDGRHIVFARLKPQDPCDTETYDLMLLDVQSGQVETLVRDLTLLGTQNEPWSNLDEECDFFNHRPSSLTNGVRFITDYLGALHLAPVLDWLQPSEESQASESEAFVRQSE